MKILLISEEGRLINNILDDILKDVLNMDDDIRPDTEDVVRVLAKAVEYNTNLGYGFDITINNGKIHMGRPDGKFYAHYAVERQEDDYYTFTKYGYEAEYRHKEIYNGTSYNEVMDVLLNEMRGTGSKKIFIGHVNETSMVSALAEMLKLLHMYYDDYSHKYAWVCIDKNGMVTTRFDDETLVVDKGYEVYFEICDTCSRTNKNGITNKDGVTITRFVRED